MIDTRLLNTTRTIALALLLGAGLLTTACNPDTNQDNGTPSGNNPGPATVNDPTTVDLTEHWKSIEPFAVKHRVMIIGWDGATFRLIDPMIRQGRLPNIKALMARGTQAELKSTVIPISSEAWAAVATGKGPGKTGILGFYTPIPNTYQVELVNNEKRQGNTLWRIFNAYGLPVVVWGIPVTYPVEKVNGIMVGGMLAPKNSVYAWPPALHSTLELAGFLPDLGKWTENTELDMTNVRMQLEIKRTALLRAMKDVDWKLFMVNFKSLDVVSHRYYFGETKGEVAETLEMIDSVLGDLVNAAGEETDIMVISDHGFFNYGLQLSINGWLAENGFLKLKPKAVRDRLLKEFDDLSDASLEEKRMSEWDREILRIDLSKTVAYGTDKEAAFGGIRLNLKGREPEGIVDPQDADRILAEIEAKLRAQQVPNRRNKPAILNIYRTRELYPGPQQDMLPDLLFETDQRYMVKVEHELPAIKKAQRTLPSHDDVGIFVGAGPSFRQNANRDKFSILNIAPLALHIAGLPVYREMDGRPPSVVLKSADNPRVIKESEDPQLQNIRVVWASHFSDADRRDAEGGLKGLGYLPSDDDDEDDRPRTKRPGAATQRARNKSQQDESQLDEDGAD